MEIFVMIKYTFIILLFFYISIVLLKIYKLPKTSKNRRIVITLHFEILIILTDIMLFILDYHRPIHHNINKIFLSLLSINEILLIIGGFFLTYTFNMVVKSWKQF